MISDLDTTQIDRLRAEIIQLRAQLVQAERHRDNARKLNHQINERLRECGEANAKLKAQRAQP